MSSRVFLNVALSRVIQRVSCSVASQSLLGLSQNLAKSLALVSDISLVILWVYLRFIALSWSVPASLRRASMLHISFRMILRVPFLGCVSLWFELTSLECFNLRPFSCVWFVGLVGSGTMLLLTSEVVLAIRGCFCSPLCCVDSSCITLVWSTLLHCRT